MNIYELRASLFDTIGKWIEKTGSTTEGFANLDLIVGAMTANHITDIIMSVLLAMAESQKYRDDNE